MESLIVYSTKYGCTQKCVERLVHQLNGNIHTVNLKDEINPSVEKYDNIIIGGPIYIGQIGKEVVEFCKNNLEALKGKRIGLFICAMRDEKGAQEQINAAFPKELLERAIVKENFGGEFIFSKMKFVDKMIVKLVAKTSNDTSKILDENITVFAKTMNQ